MKILCNLHPLGRGSMGSAARTGVFRVVEQLAGGLAESAACDTTFHAVDHLWESWRYFETHLRTPHTRFAYSPQRVSAARHVARLEHFVGTTAQNRAFSMRLLRSASARYTRVINPLLSRLDDALLREAEIYHSPFLPIAEVIKRHGHLRRFTTVYDLIAITHPEFFTPPVTHLIRLLVNGFDEVDHVLCISHATRAALLEHAPRLDPERVFVAPLAAGPIFRPESDAAKIADVRKKIRLPPNVPYFLSLCTLEPRKNLDAVIHAFARLRREKQIDPTYRLVLVGNLGWKTEKIFSALEDAHDCRDAILLTGFLPDEDLAALYTGARAFVYMARIEGFGLPPLEAMQCGTPVITSNTSSLPEVVGDAGIQLAPDDLDGLCAALLSLVSDDARHRDLSDRALRRAKEFTWQKFIDQNLAAYRTSLR